MNSFYTCVCVCVYRMYGNNKKEGEWAYVG